MNGLIDVLATRTPSAALQAIESGAGSADQRSVPRGGLRESTTTDQPLLVRCVASESPRKPLPPATTTRPRADCSDIVSYSEDVLAQSHYAQASQSLTGRPCTFAAEIREYTRFKTRFRAMARLNYLGKLAAPMRKRFVGWPSTGCSSL